MGHLRGRFHYNFPSAPFEMKKTYDLQALKAIPILHVADKLGVRVVAGSQNIQFPGDDTVSSCAIFTKTNSFVRFSGKERGGCSKGSVIDFVRHCTDNPSFKDACEYLSTLL